MFQLIGAGAAEKNSENIMKVETAIAQASRKMEDLRDPYKNYNKLSIAEINKLTPSINWLEIMSASGLKKCGYNCSRTT